MTSDNQTDRPGTHGDWVTVTQAADALGLSAPTVYAQIAHGRIATVRIDGQYRISPVELARYRCAHLGRAGWDTRRAPGYVPTKNAEYARRSRARQRDVGVKLNPMDVETRLAGRPDTATVAVVIDALRADPAWSVSEVTLPGRIAAIELRHAPCGRTYTLRRRHAHVLWKLERPSLS